jgi:hypothetical protein
MREGQIDLCANTGDSEGVVFSRTPFVGIVMQYSNTLATPPRLRAILLATLILVAQPTLAEPDLLAGDLGLSSSKSTDTPDNALINPDNIRSAPAVPSITPVEAAELVRAKTGGQVMSVNTLHNDKGVIYGVKVLNAGRMRIINVDGQTGRLLNN